MVEVFGARAFRLALAFAAAIATATFGVFVLIYLEVAREDVARAGAILSAEAVRSAAAPESQLRAALAARQTADIRRIDYLAVFDAEGRVAFGNLPQMPDMLLDGAPHVLPGAQMEALGAPRAAAVMVARRRPDGGLLVIGRNLQDSEDIEASLRRAFALALAPTVAAILIIGALFARRAQARLDVVQNAIAHIMEGDFGARLPISHDADEIDRVAAGVNRMLDEIVRLLDQLRSVGDNIAHDLRAPLAVARARLERAFLADGPILRVQLEGAMAELDRAAVTISALLRISAVENGPRHKHFRDVDLAEVASGVCEFYAPLAEAKGSSLRLIAPGPAPLRGDADLLREAVSNLTENAVKYTPDGGRIEVEVRLDEGHPTLEVRDDGPGVPPVEREAIFRRFYRGASHAEPGNGLGLSIARTIAELHGFELTAQDNGTGARFVMRAAAKARLAASKF